MIIFHERYLDHRQADEWHPEQPERLLAIVARLTADGLWRDILTPQPAEWADCARVHDEAYLRQLQTRVNILQDPDTYVRPATFEIARLSTGGAILAAETAWRERRQTLALLRPPGHHARPAGAMGFCYLNNIAVAAARLIAQGQARRVAIVDIDVHHGNGTSEIFYTRPDVLFISLHQFPLFPGTGGLGTTGAGDGRGHNIDVLLPPGSGDATYRHAWERLAGPVLEQFRPEIILVSFGTDAHYRDPLANMELSSPGLVGWVDRLRELAENICAGRLALMLEGGYDLESLAEVTAGIEAAATGAPFAPGDYQFTENHDPAGLGNPVVDQIVALHKKFWKL